MINKIKITNNLKVFLEEDNVELLDLLIEKSKEEVKEFCNIDTIQESMESIIEDYSIYLYNTINRTGIEKENLGGISVEFSNDIPKKLKNKMFKYRVIKFA